MRYRRVHSPGSSYFFTVVTAKRLPLFANDMAVTFLREAIQAEMTRRHFIIDAMVILPDHIHALWTLPFDDCDYSIRWRNIKRSLTYKVKQSVLSDTFNQKSKLAFWQRRFWEHRIRDEADFNHHVNYIHYNPVNHGLVLNPVDWQFSSIHRYIKSGILKPNWGVGNIVSIPESIGHE